MIAAIPLPTTTMNSPSFRSLPAIMIHVRTSRRLHALAVVAAARTVFTVVLSVLLVVISGFVLRSADADEASWPQFRGPTGQGHATVSDVPLHWSESENVAWKTALPGLGWSSPVVAEGRIWLTAAITRPATPEQKERSFAGRSDARQLDLAASVSLHALCIDLETGKLIRDVQLFEITAPNPIHSMNSYASPTPLFEDGRLYCHFGSYGTACVDTRSGRVLWRADELKVDHQNGPGASPALWENLLIIHYDGIDRQFATALDKHTGHVVWKVDRSGKMNARAAYRKAYCTPLVAKLSGRWQVISPAADWVYAYDPATGEELWKAAYGKLGFSTVPRPVAGHGMVYICTSFTRSRLLAIRHDGAGDVSDSHVAWMTDRQVPRMPSVLLVDNELIMVSDGGIATCLDAKTGADLWQERLPGDYSASPLLAGGRIYLSNRDGVTTVLQPGREFKSLATNRLDGRIMASPAPIEGGLIYRTDSHLYRIGANQPATP